MSFAQGVISQKLVDRVRAILMRPKEEWLVIDGEQTTIAILYRTYVVLLAAIGPVANAIGGALFGTNLPGVGAVRVPVVNAIVGALVAFALALVGVYVVAQVIDNLAPRFSGTRNLTQAFKVAAYSSTAQWVAGIFALIPALSPLSIVGLYSLYLLYLGLPVLMKVPQEKATSYTIAVVVVALLVFIVIGAVSGIVLGTAAFMTL
jgi:Yip1 domain